ncbi:MAG: UTP--glucose-1-phosphate uridylyltransferase [Deltaproteobacteria bacterium]|nr:UTP--glucose-1-phosphate uridylyltransferase [Deltaproteobacteria bacterium]
MSNIDLEKNFAVIESLMKKEGVPALNITAFKYYYTQLVRGETGLISEKEIGEVGDLPDLECMSDQSTVGKENVKRAVIIKLNGGLGTSMGLDAAKTLLPAKGKYTFFDIIIRQVLELRKSFDCNLPVIFMNSFRTEQDTLNALKEYPEFAEGQNGIPVSFVQGKIPKIRQDNLLPVTWEKDPSLAWCPPGHGDIYLSMLQTGILDNLLKLGYRYAFISNSDNLGAVIDLNILGFFADKNTPFMMEVADRTAADHKGGHLARTREGSLLLRESAQCPSDEQEAFQDISKYKYFNTNSLWVNLEALSKLLSKNENMLPLPLMRNAKTVDPLDESSPKVYQLETAMGAAILNFSGSMALRVPRSRFAPIKKNEDLLALWSDIFYLNQSFHVCREDRRRHSEIVIDLDPQYYKSIASFKERFVHGVPSLLDCRTLKIKGDVAFGENVVLKGDVVINNSSGSQKLIPANCVIEGEYNF